MRERTKSFFSALSTLLEQKGIRFLILGALLLGISWPFWSRPSNQSVSSLFIYLFVLWFVLIVLLFLTSRCESALPSEVTNEGEDDA